MAIRSLLTALALAALTAGPAAAAPVEPPASVMGTWACAGVYPYGSVCVHNPWEYLP